MGTVFRLHPDTDFTHGTADQFILALGCQPELTRVCPPKVDHLYG
jgi:hypothetical protein